jgi:hypothetical protein
MNKKQTYDASVRFLFKMLLASKFARSKIVWNSIYATSITGAARIAAPLNSCKQGSTLFSCLLFIG